MGSGISSPLSRPRSIFSKKQRRGAFNHESNKNKIEDRYAVDYILGRGGYSVIFHGIEKLTKKEVAIKRMKLEPGDLEKVNSVFAELDAFKRIQSHDFIVNLHSAFYLNECCYFVMDCFSGGDLRHFLRINNSLDEQTVVYILACIGSALHHLHIRGVIHRDVKPENIGLDMRGRPYLTDFGISIVSSTDNPLPLCQSSSGTLPYLAPEVLCPGNYHSYQSDFWSLGVTGYELLFGHRPFSCHCSFESIKLVLNEYGWMWDSLRSNPPAEPIDLATLHPPIDWIYPYPDPFLRLNEDGTLPDCHIILLPSHSRASFASFLEHTLVSEECHNLLTGLLDVRIPSRLGSLCHYSKFDEHECFKLHGCFPFSILQRIESPLHSRLKFKAHGPSLQIFSSFGDDDNLDEDEDKNGGDNLHVPLLESFSPEIKQKLLDLSCEDSVPPITPLNHTSPLASHAPTATAIPATTLALTSSTPPRASRTSHVEIVELL
jgi:serine/threonine protein kinase